MRRFLLTYTREGHSLEVEGILFSTGGVALEPYPDDEYPCPRGFVNFADMEYSINEFGESSVTWLDEEERHGITRACLEALAQERGFTVAESHLDIYFSSFGRSFDETFLTVMDGETHVVQFNAALLEDWVPESYVMQELDAYQEREAHL